MRHSKSASRPGSQDRDAGCLGQPGPSPASGAFLMLPFKNQSIWGLPEGPGTKTPLSHCRGAGFNPWLGIRFHMPPLRPEQSNKRKKEEEISQSFPWSQCFFLSEEEQERQSPGKVRPEPDPCQGHSETPSLGREGGCEPHQGEGVAFGLRSPGSGEVGYQSPGLTSPPLRSPASSPTRSMADLGPVSASSPCVFVAEQRGPDSVPALTPGLSSPQNPGQKKS